MTRKFNSIEERNAFFHKHYAEIMQRCHICVLHLCHQHAYQQYEEVMEHAITGAFKALDKLDDSKDWLRNLYPSICAYADRQLCEMELK